MCVFWCNRCWSFSFYLYGNIRVRNSRKQSGYLHKVSTRRILSRCKRLTRTNCLEESVLHDDSSLSSPHRTGDGFRHTDRGIASNSRSSLENDDGSGGEEDNGHDSPCSDSSERMKLSLDIKQNNCFFYFILHCTLRDLYSS